MIEFDPEKEADGHGLAFNLATDLFAGEFVEEEDRRFDYGEQRFKATGPVAQFGGRICVAIFTWRGERRRVISFRKANDREVERYGASDPTAVRRRPA